jgi:hypothetical protein
LIFSKPITKFLNILGINIIDEKDDYNFESSYLKPGKGITFYVGGWHSEKYFVDIKNTIQSTFQFKINNIGSDNLEILYRIQSSNSVSVHVRRGDFLNADNINKLGAVCTLGYFLMAIEKMKLLVTAPHFYFFTNDVPWVRENFSGTWLTIIDINKSENSWKDMFLISNCNHHINSNGSFSWWSAWLGIDENGNTIVPRNFTADRHFSDIYPENWIQISDY